MIRLRTKAGVFLPMVVLGLFFFGWSGSFLRALAYQTDIPEIVISDNNKELVVDCNASAVIVNGNHNTLTLLGTCSSLTLRGNKNTVTLEAPTVVTDTGNNNVITFLGFAAATATSAPTATQAPTDTPTPTNTPEVPTDTPENPTATPEGPTDTPQTPTSTPESPTDTPLPATETPAADTEAPTVRWIAPVLAGERYDIRDGDQVILEAEASDNVSVTLVRILWWDAVNELYITLGTFAQPPFRIQINASGLNTEWNQIFVVASDGAQNSSAYASIWLYKMVLPGSQSGYQMFLPVARK